MTNVIRVAAIISMVGAAVAGGCPGGAKAQSGPKAFPAGSKMAELASLGKIRVGVQTQYPLTGMKTLTGYSGFDIEIAEIVAAKLGIPKKNVEYVPVTTPTREPFLQQDKVDMVIAAYTMTPARAKVIDFAGPYFPSPSGILVKTGNPNAIKSLDDLKGKTGCFPAGSSQEAFITANFPEVKKSAVFFDSSAKCAQAVINGQADASSTDIAILAAFVKQNEGKLEVIDYSYDNSSWGIGVAKTEDKTFCKWINTVLAESFKDGSWANAYKTTIGTVVPGAGPTPPTLGDCSSVN